MPRTRTGRWTGWLFVVSIVLLAVLIVAYNTDALGPVSQRTAGGLALWVVTAISSVGALVAGAVSLVRFKDRSAVVILATIYGALVTVVVAFGAIPEN